MVMDFYCRYVYAARPTCEGYMIRLASNLWSVERTFPGWGGAHVDFLDHK